MQAYEQSKKTSSLSTLHILERMLVPGQQKHITSLRSVLGNMQRGESNSDQISQAVDGLLILWAESPLLKEELLKIMRDFLAFCRSKKEPILEKIQGEMACRIASMKPEDTELLALFIPDDGHYPDGVLRHAISANNLRALAFLVGDSSDKLYLAFSIAISLNNADAIEFILPKLNLDAALNTAVREDNPPAIKLLLQKGANPNSALDTVISTDNLGTLELLLKLSKHSADPYLALDIALNLDKKNTAHFILQYIDDLGLAFNTAVEEDNPRVMNFLLEHGVNPNFALSTAMRSENLVILGLLLQKGADPNAALTMAIRARKEFTIKFLLESSGINPNHKNSDDRSLLSIAIEEASNDPTAWRVVLSLLKPDAHVEETEHLDSKVLLSWLFLNEDPNKPTADDIRYLQQCGLIKPETLDKMLSEVSELLLNSALERLPLNNQFLQLKGFLKLFPGNKSESSSLFKTLCDLRVITDDTTIQTYSQRLRDTATRLLGAGVPLNNDWAALLKMALFTEDAALIKVLLAQAKDNAEKQSEKYLLSGGDLYKAIDIKGLGRREIIDLFVENIDLFDPEWINTYGYIAIRLAIQHDDLETIKQLLVLGANIEPPQTTPLVLYVADDANQALEKIKLLLDYGADPRPILAMPLICKQLLKVKSWSECIFHYEHVKAHKRLEYRYDDTSLLHELSYEDKEPWINKLSKILKAPLPSKPLWYEKTEREIVSLLLEKIKNHHDPLQFVAIAIAMEKTFHDAEIDIPENIQTILNQL
ncbi:MAG: hypothetical protein K0Q74_1112, partial [Gammaproteobacteria bacterium]|nr:hypothetical protein [Gammaproteobacteria bacterium]